MSSSINPALINLRFIPEFSESQYELFEVDSEILKEIEAGNKGFKMSIKPFVQELAPTPQAVAPSMKTAGLCTKDATYKLKKSDTTNTFHLTDLKTGDIYK